MTRLHSVYTPFNEIFSVRHDCAQCLTCDFRHILISRPLSFLSGGQRWRPRSLRPLLLPLPWTAALKVFLARADGGIFK